VIMQNAKVIKRMLWTWTLLTQTWAWFNPSGNVINPNTNFWLTQMGMWLMDRMWTRLTKWERDFTKCKLDLLNENMINPNHKLD
jgi:hypothetical protein